MVHLEVNSCEEIPDLNGVIDLTVNGVLHAGCSKRVFQCPTLEDVFCETLELENFSGFDLINNSNVKALSVSGAEVIVGGKEIDFEVFADIMDHLGWNVPNPLSSAKDTGFEMTRS